MPAATTGIATSAPRIPPSDAPPIAATITSAPGTVASANGTFAVTLLKPGTYNVKVTKFGFTFADPTDTTTLGPTDTGNNLLAITP